MPRDEAARRRCGGEARSGGGKEAVWRGGAVASRSTLGEVGRRRAEEASHRRGASRSALREVGRKRTISRLGAIDQPQDRSRSVVICGKSAPMCIICILLQDFDVFLTDDRDNVF
jgi:hypothetical protein